MGFVCICLLLRVLNPLLACEVRRSCRCHATGIVEEDSWMMANDMRPDNERCLLLLGSSVLYQI